MPEIGRWGAVDPLRDKYVNMSPFMYVANQPIRAIDPDGKRIVFVVTGKDGKSENFQYRNGNFYHNNGKGRRYDPGKEAISKTMYRTLSVLRAMERSGSKELVNVIKTLEESKLNHYIVEGSRNHVKSGPDIPWVSEIDRMVKNGEPIGTVFFINLSEADKKLFEESEGVQDSDITTIAHELKHQYDYDQRNMADSLE